MEARTDPAAAGQRAGAAAAPGGGGVPGGALREARREAGPRRPRHGRPSLPQPPVRPADQKNKDWPQGGTRSTRKAGEKERACGTVPGPRFLLSPFALLFLLFLVL